MRSDTQQAVYQLIKSFAQSTILEYDVAKLRLAYPFHRILFDDAGLIAFKQERRVVTRMGAQLYPQLARVIALENYTNVEREKDITGLLEEAQVNAIERIVRELRDKRRKPNHAQELEEIGQATEIPGKVPVRVIADLYIGDFRPGPLFLEIKTPVPNLDICAESKKKILLFESLYAGQGAKGYLAFAYNPYVERILYGHPFTKRIMDLESEVLMGVELWDKIGGEGTFSELLGLIDVVGEEIQKLT